MSDMEPDQETRNSRNQNGSEAIYKKDRGHERSNIPGTVEEIKTTR